MTSAEAKKLDILLALKAGGYNLLDGDKPEIMNMSLGGGYTLECNVKKPTKDWKIIFNDGVETTEYPADSEQIVHTYRGDADKLIKKFDADLKNIGVVEAPTDTKNLIPPVESKEPSIQKNNNAVIKHKKRAKTLDSPGMMIPIVYPSEMKGCFMRFKQWTVDNGVIPKNSEVVILEDNDSNFRVSIPQAHISFDIQKDKAEVVGVEAEI